LFVGKVTVRIVVDWRMHTMLQAIARDDLLQRYGIGDRVFTNVDLSRNDFTGAVLHGADFSGAEFLSKRLGHSARNIAILRQANLSEANLSHVKARGVDFREAILCDSILQDADLRDADFNCAILRNADLRGADLRGADLQDADLSGADLRGANMRRTIVRSANLRGTVLDSDNLRGRNVREAFIESQSKARLRVIISPAADKNDVDSIMSALRCLHRNLGLGHDLEVDKVEANGSC
jgi:uncharacterized protein YjbI with pentapeptide repeats